MKRRTFLFSTGAALTVAACGGDAAARDYGPDPNLPEPQRGLFPSMVVSRPEPWGDRKPTVPNGYTVDAIATDLAIPRQTLMLPNGDILIAEGSGGGAPTLRPKDFFRRRHQGSRQNFR